jgi:hypothetical protein
VTFCPLCNSAVVFDRRVAGRTVTFGVSGKLRNSDLIMYDHQTKSWWQQFTGRAIVGEMTGAKLDILPMRMESIERFRARHPAGRVLLPPQDVSRPYGRNPYASYDTSTRPFLYSGDLPPGIPPLERVVVVDSEAWSFSYLRLNAPIEKGDLLISWEAGQNSALDAREIAQGRDVGNVVVQRRKSSGELVDAVHDVSFAFAFHAFHPNGTIHHE